MKNNEVCNGPKERSGTVTVSGAVTVTGTATVSGTVTVSGTATVSGAVTVSGTATVIPNLLVPITTLNHHVTAIAPPQRCVT